MENRVGLGIVAVLVNHLVARGVDAGERRPTHGDPDVAAAEADFAAGAGDLRRDDGLDPVGERIDAGDAAVRLAEHPEGACPEGGKARARGHGDHGRDSSGGGIHPVDLAFIGADHPDGAGIELDHGGVLANGYFSDGMAGLYAHLRERAGMSELIADEPYAARIHGDGTFAGGIDLDRNAQVNLVSSWVDARQRLALAVQHPDAVRADADTVTRLFVHGDAGLHGVVDGIHADQFIRLGHRHPDRTEAGGKPVGVAADGDFVRDGQSGGIKLGERGVSFWLLACFCFLADSAQRGQCQRDYERSQGGPAALLFFGPWFGPRFGPWSSKGFHANSMVAHRSGVPANPGFYTRFAPEVLFNTIKIVLLAQDYDSNRWHLASLSIF
jgi:hypothetical protein